MRLIVTGVTRTGNLGGTAMLCAIQDVLLPHVSAFQLASILPAKDRSVQNSPDKAEILSADFKIWLLLIAPLCVLLWPFRRFEIVKGLAARLPILKHFAHADAVADLSGVAFIDGRGLPLLAYNVAVSLPGLFFDKPVYKLSQAVGPFKQPLNRFAAKAILGRCARVDARGKISLQHLHELGLIQSRYVPDTSFALDIPDDLRAEAKRYLEDRLGENLAKPLVMISPSAVVQKYCEGVGKDFVHLFGEVIQTLHDQGLDCALLPHSTDTGIAKNDDLSVVKAIQQQVKEIHDFDVVVLDAKGDPRWARALVGQADAFIACRFHSMIAALSQAVPVVVVGWSHKYQEAAAPFAEGQQTLDYSDLSVDALVNCLQSFIANEQKLKPMMQQVAQECREASAAMIQSVNETPS